jgi:hypothetical protein
LHPATAPAIVTASSAAHVAIEIRLFGIHESYTNSTAFIDDSDNLPASEDQEPSAASAVFQML